MERCVITKSKDFNEGSLNRVYFVVFLKKEDISYKLNALNVSVNPAEVSSPCLNAHIVSSCCETVMVSKKCLCTAGGCAACLRVSLFLLL